MVFLEVQWPERTWRVFTEPVKFNVSQSDIMISSYVYTTTPMAIQRYMIEGLAGVAIKNISMSAVVHDDNIATG